MLYFILYIPVLCLRNALARASVCCYTKGGKKADFDTAKTEKDRNPVIVT